MFAAVAVVDGIPSSHQRLGLGQLDAVATANVASLSTLMTHQRVDVDFGQWASAVSIDVDVNVCIVSSGKSVLNVRSQPSTIRLRRTRGNLWECVFRHSRRVVFAGGLVPTRTFQTIHGRVCQMSSGTCGVCIFRARGLRRLPSQTK